MPHSTLSIKPRDYQQSIFNTTKNFNTLVVLPTGTGKTLIALMLTIERLKKHPMSKVLFLAPTKPLVEQHLQTFESEIPELFAQLNIFTGTISPEKRKALFDKADIIFSTPQCISNDLENRLYNLNDVSLIIFDECHRCIRNYSYTKVVNFYKEQSINPLILGLTASPGSEQIKVKEICKHLNIQEVESRTRESHDVKPYLQDLSFTKIEVPFPTEFIEIQTLLKIIYNEKINILREKNFLFPPINKISLLSLQKRLFSQINKRNFAAMYAVSICAQAIKISHAIELLETQTLSGLNIYLKSISLQAKEKKSKAAQTIANSPQFNAALISLKSLLEKKIEHPKVNTLISLIEDQFKENRSSKVIIFAQFRDTIHLLEKKLNKLKNINARVFLGQTKKSNSSGQSGLSQKEQKQIIEDFRSGKINVLCSTSIGEEGLDIPEVSSVIFYEPIPSAIRAIQRRGRTARLQPGKLFILLTKDTRDIGIHYAARAREKKMHKTLESVKAELKNKNKQTTL